MRKSASKRMLKGLSAGTAAKKLLSGIETGTAARKMLSTENEYARQLKKRIE